MPLPAILRVKLSTEAAGAIALTAVVAREMPVRDLVEEMLPFTGKDEERVRATLARGTLVSGGSRFRWTGFDAGAGEIRALLDSFPDSDPERAFDPGRCVCAVLEGRRRKIEIPREAGSRKRLLRRESFWDALTAAVAGRVRYCEYSYRRRADRYRIEFTAADSRRLCAAAELLRYPALRSAVALEMVAAADLYVER
jgi:hypothetical protein